MLQWIFKHESQSGWFCMGPMTVFPAVGAIPLLSVRRRFAPSWSQNIHGRESTRYLRVLLLKLTLLTFDVCSGCSVWAPPPSPPTTRVRWSQPTHGTTQTLSASSPPPGDRSEARVCQNMLIMVTCAGVTTQQRVHNNFQEGGKEDGQHEILQ